MEYRKLPKSAIDYTPQDWAEVWERTGTWCPVCKKKTPTTHGDSWDEITDAHILVTAWCGLCHYVYYERNPSLDVVTPIQVGLPHDGIGVVEM